MIVYDKEQKEIVIPNGIGNIDIFNNGVEAGYNQGYEQGQADLAAKSRVFNVTKNGTYMSKYSDPIIPANVTGVYADGTEFYNYAELNGKIFNTKIAGSENSRLEFWYKGDNTLSGDGNNVIIGSGDTDKNDGFQVKYYDDNNNIIRVQVGVSIGDIHNWDDTVWHHLVISKEEGIWVDGKNEYGPLYGGTIDGEFFINGIGYDVSGDGGSIRTANGCFGMIKIDDTIIIPTADGFLNTNTGELLEVVKDGGYAFTENPPIYGEGELYKTIYVNVPDLNGSYDEGYAQGKTDGINEQKSKLESINITENGTYDREDGYNHIEVNVPDLNGSYDEGYEQGQADVAANARDIEVTKNGQYGDGKTLYKTINVNVSPKINVQKAGLKFGESKFTEVPEWADFEGITDMSSMFRNCQNLQTIPQIDTSNVTDVNSMFYTCNNLKTLPNNFNFGICTNFSSMFNYTSSLTDYSFLENWVFNPNASMDNMINNTNTTYVPAIPCVGSTSYYQSAIFWSNGEFSKLTYFGGWIGRKYNVNKDNMLKKMPNLTYESCISILNNLYDFTGNGETPNNDQGKLKVHQNFLDKVGDEISIGTAKGWQITV